jgi:hypothetical protein
MSAVQPMPSEWQEPLDLRPKYRLFRVAFFLAAVAMSLYGMSAMCYVLARLGQIPFLIRLLMSPWWAWFVGSPIMFGRLVAAILLLGRGAEPSWRSRSSLLTILSAVDIGYWSLENASALGLPFVAAAPGSDGLGLVIYRMIGIIELGLLASLGSEVTTQLGWLEGAALERVAKISAGIGMTLWLIVAMNQLDWRAGFPPRFRWFRDLETYLIFLASLVARAVSAFFVTVLCANACVLCSRTITEIERLRKENDPLRSRSELP